LARGLYFVAADPYISGSAALCGAACGNFTSKILKNPLTGLRIER
jgi:hypothetical protein